MKKKGVVKCILLFLIVLSGCEPNNVSEQDYHTGTQGIEFTFMQNSPPSQVFEGDQIPFAVEVRNKGAASTQPRFWLSGHDESIIHLSWRGITASPSTLEARNYENPIGGYATLDAGSVGVSLPNDVDTYQTTLRLTACYPYTTYASTQICVDPDITNNKDDACTAKDVSVGGGQGGPVSITHISEESSRQKLRFTVTIENRGKGTVVGRDHVSSCMNLREQDLNVVRVSARPVSGRQVSCRPNPVRLVNGRGIVYCEADMGGFADTAFTTVLTMNLDYGYKSSITRSIGVRRI